MQRSDIPADPLVIETVNAFREAIAEKYKDSKYGPTPDMLELKMDDFDFEENPALQILEKTDALDSLAAAVIVAERYSTWIEPSEVKGKIDAQVYDTLELLHSEEMMMGPAAVIASGNPLALKLAVAMVAGITAGEEFKEMKAEASPAELSMMLAQVAGPLTDLADHLTENGNWKVLPPKLLDLYIEGLDNLADMTASKTQKRIITTIVTELKEQIAKANAAEVTEPAAPAQIDPTSPFVQLKDQAKKLKF